MYSQIGSSISAAILSGFALLPDAATASGQIFCAQMRGSCGMFPLTSSYAASVFDVLRRASITHPFASATLVRRLMS